MLNPEDVRIHGLPNEEKRQVLYNEFTDKLMMAAQGYEKEGNATKATAMWDLWTAKRLEIRTKFSD